MSAELKTLFDVHKQLIELDKQFVDNRDNVFAKMAKVVESAIGDVKEINNALCVSAAEYVPAIGDAFDIIDRMGLHVLETKATQ